MEYVTKKVPARIVPLITKLQAELTLAEGRRVTEAEVIAEAVDEFARKPAVRKKYSMSEFCGSIKGGRVSREEDVDRVVYGDVNRT